MTALRYGLFAVLIALAIYATMWFLHIDPQETFDSAFAYLARMGTL